MRKIIKLFEKGNVSVCGLMGSGKDVLFGNVIARRRKPYISNTDYGGDRIVFDPNMLNFQNTWRNFMEGRIKHFVYPYADGIDFYVSDLALYAPSQYQADLCKDYPYFPFSMALVRQVCGGWFHFNVQNLNRAWDKIREQSDTYIRCIWCKFFFGCIVVQKVILYEKYESALNRVPPFRLRKPLINPTRLQLWEIQKLNYEISYGSVEPRILIYFNRSKHNTRVFKEMMENA